MTIEQREVGGTSQATQAVAIYGNTFMISGALSLLHYRRMTDILNQQNDTFLTVNEAAIRQLRWPGSRTPRTTPMVRVNKDDIVMAMPIQRAAIPSSRQTDEFVRVAKVPHRVIVLTPSFEIRGYMHLIREVTLREVPEVLRQQFVALTDATIIYLPRPEEPPLNATFVNISIKHMLALFEDTER